MDLKKKTEVFSSFLSGLEFKYQKKTMSIVFLEANNFFLN